MAVMDEFKEEREALKNATMKQKLSYFWDYNKWYVIIGIFIIMLGGLLIYQYVTKKEPAFNAAMVNTTIRTEDVTYANEFADYAGIDTDKYDIYFDTSIFMQGNAADEASYSSAQKLMVFAAAGEWEVMITDYDSFQTYANGSAFHDLREILSEEQIAKYEPYFYYVDLKTVEEVQAANDTYDEGYVGVYPDPDKPEEMEVPIPVGINLNSCKKLHETYNFIGEDVVLGVYCNTERLDNALKYIDFVMQDAE